MLKINDKIPELALSALVNGEEKALKLSALRGKWLVLIFYPGDFTFVCPTELEEAASHYDEFKKLGAEVISISTDSVFVHRAWQEQSPAIRKVKYPMGADPTGRISREFGVYIEEEGVALRGSFIIDPDGVLKTMEIHDNKIGRSIKELLRRLKAAKFVRDNPALVCPVEWEPGQKTLKPGMDLVGKI